MSAGLAVRRSLAVLPVLGGLLVAGAGYAAEDGPDKVELVEVHARMADPTAPLEGDSPVRATVVMEPVSDTGESAKVLPIEVPGASAVELPTGSVWRVELRHAGFWSPEATASAGSGRLDLALYATGQLAGRVHTDKATLPAELSIAFAPVPEEAAEKRPARPSPAPTARPLASELAPPGGRTDCPVREDGSWTCELPAGRFDLHLKAAGFASQFRWNVEVLPRQATAVGDLALQPGAAVFGFVEPAEGVLDPQEVEVELTPATVDDPPAAARLDRLVRTTSPDRQGFFQFTDLTAGLYVVSVRSRDFAPVRLKPIPVLAGRETDVGEPILLQQRCQLTVRLDPPWSHYEKPWRLQLVPRDPRLPHVEGETDRLGGWSTSDPVPGLYSLFVGGPDGERWLSRQVELSAGPQVLDIELPQVRVEGVVTRGTEPVRARITFRDPADPTAIVLYSDPEGHFEGWLTREGLWSVFLLFDRQGAQQEIEPVVVEAPPGGAAYLALEVPDTTLIGVVRSEAGEPVEGVTVRAWSPESSLLGSSGRTDRDGRFEFRGLPEGRYHLTAFRGSQSGTEIADVASTGEPSEVDVRLLGVRPWSGRIASRQGAVPGAEIWIRAEVATPRQMPYIKATTGPLGEFAVGVPADAEWLDVIVLAFGRGARIMRWAPESQPEIFIDELGGSLALHLDGISPRTAHLRHGDSWFHVGALHRWARVHGMPTEEGADLVLPAMEPGAYRLCRGAGDEDCDSAFLAPDGLVHLSIESETDDDRSR
jgi:hypothetical protein